MDAAYEKRLSMALDVAERQGLWLVPIDHAQEVALRLRASQGILVSPVPGCFVRKQSFDDMKPRQKAFVTIKTLASLHTDWVFCSYSAAVVHGLWVSNTLLNATHIRNLGEYGRAGEQIVRHENRLRAEDVVYCQGIRVTSLAYTLMDCLCGTEFRLALPLIDSALHWGLISTSDFEKFLRERGFGRRGIRRARMAAVYADGRSGSALESLARAVMIELGFQVPELQVELFDPMEPDNPKYGDFGWLLDSSRPVIGEADGLGKYARGARTIERAVRAMSRERRREAHINLTNATVIRFSYEDVLDTAYFERLLETAGVPRVSRSNLRAEMGLQTAPSAETGLRTVKRGLITA